MGLIEAGWFADPSSAHGLRYWDGWAWTQHVSDHGIHTESVLGTADWPPPSTKPLSPSAPAAASVSPAAPAHTPPPAPAPTTPRGPLDHQPDEPGWWLASDGKWYAPELAAPTQAVPVTPLEQTAAMSTVGRTSKTKSPMERVRAWPLWAKIAIPVVAVLLIAGIASAGQSSSKPDVIPVATTTTKVPSTAPRTAPVTAPRTTTPPPTTEAKPVVTKPVIPPPTRPPATKPPATQPPATQPPATPPPAAANPGDAMNCSDFADYAAAKSWFDTYFPTYGDVAGLDSDGDGIPCESLAGAP